MTRAEARDVVVIGGGHAGVAAALAAAGTGARTLLVERSDRLGGNAALAFVHTLCGLYEPAGDGPPRALYAGLPARVAAAYRREGVAGEPERAGRVHVLPTDPLRIPEALAALCRSAPTLALALETTVSAVTLAGATDAPSQLTLTGPDGPRSVEAGAVVDASGDACTALAGAAWEQASPEALQHASYIVRLAGVDTEALAGFERMKLTHAVHAAVREARLPAGCESVLLRRGLVPGDAHLTFNVPKEPGVLYDPLDPACVEALSARARQGVAAVVAYLCETRPAFRDARVRAWPERVGVRETRRLLGPVVLDAAAILAGTRREDEVTRSAWPIELWHDHRRPELRYPEGPCSVPLGALISRSHPRLAMAGRCLSATHEAHGALRVIGTALATGEAAGLAAALAVDAGTALADVRPAAVRAAIERAA